ncbi:MAG TPA: cupredoxin domain-containing protein [Jatrophihabitans sp.]|jgi:plastocyanin|uniref:cupredoxin domain-containing protein n=1 Tax=Jatrophihabitans sp. TaxID=1932789 RepID=UPI002E075934|nr:cupredoxin domain-containing protein [Jatrophihabitans sp.]
MMRSPVAAGVLAALLTFTACSSSSSPPARTGSSAATPGGPTITIRGYGYSGALTVKPGARVTVTNDDGVAHTLTDKKTKKFDTGNIPADGGTGTFTAPATPGSYPFRCNYHPAMAGTLVVKA